MIKKATLIILVSSLVFLGSLIHNLSSKTTTSLSQLSLSTESIMHSEFGSTIHVNQDEMKQSQAEEIVVTVKNGSNYTYPLGGEGDREETIGVDFAAGDVKSLTLIKKTSRLLMDYDSGVPFLDYSMFAFEILFQTFRNLILIAFCTNLLDACLPFILLCDSFLMMAFLDTEMHLLQQFYYNIFNSKYDLFNAIRLGASPSPSSDCITSLSKYNFTENIAFNLSGEIVVVIIFLTITILLKIGTIFCSSQRLRSIKTALRPSWNGLFIVLLPRFGTFSGFHIRMLTGSALAINGITSILIFIMFLLFFIMLLCQIRSIISKIEYIEDTKYQIGLASRINHREEFQFDCLSFNMLYHPLIDYLRLLIFFVPIGAGREIYYVSFGGPIFSQLFIMMADISCPHFTQRKDRVLGPLNNFLLLLIELSIISVGLSESVNHSEVSLICETVLFGMACFLYPTAFLSILVDVRLDVKRRRGITALPEEVDDEISELTQKIGRGHGSHGTHGGHGGHGNKGKKGKTPLNKTVKKTEQSENLKEDDSELDDYSADALTKKNSNKVFHLKIKKVKRGRMI